MSQPNSNNKIVILTIFDQLKHIPSKGIEDFGRTVGTPLYPGPMNGGNIEYQKNQLNTKIRKTERQKLEHG